MANTLCSAFSDTPLTVTGPTTSFSTMGMAIQTTTGFPESDMQCIFRSTGTFSNLWINIITNSFGVSTATFRKNGANGNQTTSIGANATGTFVDNTHTDSASSGDLFDLAIALPSGTHTQNMNNWSVTFAASTNTVTRIGVTLGTEASGFNSNATAYITPAGGDYISGNGQTSESKTTNRMRKSFTIKNCAVNVYYNSGGNVNTWQGRKNGANGNIAVSVTKLNTGIFEDTTHSDSVSAGDDYNYASIPGTGIQNYGPQTAYADFISSNNDGILSTTNDSLQTINPSTTSYWGLSGDLSTPYTTESKAQTITNTAYKFSELVTNIISNTLGTSTLTLRANGSSSGVSASIGASATGIFSDSSHTYTSNTTDLMDYQLTAGSTGTSMNVSFISVFTNVSSAVGVTTFAQNFKNLPPNPNSKDWQLLQFQTNEPVFGI